MTDGERSELAEFRREFEEDRDKRAATIKWAAGTFGGLVLGGFITLVLLWADVQHLKADVEAGKTHSDRLAVLETDMRHIRNSLDRIEQALTGRGG